MSTYSDPPKTVKPGTPLMCLRAGCSMGIQELRLSAWWPLRASLRLRLAPTWLIARLSSAHLAWVRGGQTACFFWLPAAAIPPAQQKEAPSLASFQPPGPPLPLPLPGTQLQRPSLDRAAWNREALHGRPGHCLFPWVQGRGRRLAARGQELLGLWTPPSLACPSPKPRGPLFRRRCRPQCQDVEVL